MRNKPVATLGVIAAAALVVSGCSTLRESVGMTKVTPDEFRTVAVAPLTMPPEYSLRPPAPGQPRPSELAPDSAARQILLGQRQAVTRSAGEQILVAQAGAAQADPLARYVVDDEFGDLAHKERSFADYVMFWRNNEPRTQTSGEIAVDPATEAQRLQTLTGGQAIVIQREGRGGIKLPGL